MRRLLTGLVSAAALTLAVSISAPALADGPDPSVHQIYEAAQAGHFDQAQQMMDQVLKDHPKSGRAHYVQAELYAKQGKTAQARAELTQAETLEPGLPHESARSVQELKSALGVASRQSEGPRVIGMTSAAPQARSFPFLSVIVLVGVVLLLWMLFRRRSAPVAYGTGAPVVGGGPGGFGTPGYGGPGYGGPGSMGGGMGSGIVGGLASGLAVGAGIVAGEEVAHHFLDGGQREGGVVPQDNSGWQQSSNADMGGQDFGVNDSGGWDDNSGGGGGGGGGDDWT